MSYNLRVFFVGGYLSYRALFNWMHPTHYIPTMLGAPVFQVLFFVYIGRFAELEDDTFFVTGNAVQLSAMAGVYGMAMTIGGERWTQTLSPLMASPANRLPLFLGRSLPLIVNGFITSAFAFFVSWLLVDFELTRVAAARRWRSWWPSARSAVPRSGSSSARSACARGTSSSSPTSSSSRCSSSAA